MNDPLKPIITGRPDSPISVSVPSTSGSSSSSSSSSSRSYGKPPLPPSRNPNRTKGRLPTATKTNLSPSPPTTKQQLQEEEKVSLLSVKNMVKQPRKKRNKFIPSLAFLKRIEDEGIDDLVYSSDSSVSSSSSSSNHSDKNDTYTAATTSSTIKTTCMIRTCLVKRRRIKTQKCVTFALENNVNIPLLIETHSSTTTTTKSTPNIESDNYNTWLTKHELLCIRSNAIHELDMEHKLYLKGYLQTIDATMIHLKYYSKYPTIMGNTDTTTAATTKEDAQNRAILDYYTRIILVGSDLGFRGLEYHSKDNIHEYRKGRTLTIHAIIAKSHLLSRLLKTPSSGSSETTSTTTSTATTTASSLISPSSLTNRQQLMLRRYSELYTRKSCNWAQYMGMVDATAALEEYSTIPSTMLQEYYDHFYQNRENEFIHKNALYEQLQQYFPNPRANPAKGSLLQGTSSSSFTENRFTGIIDVKKLHKIYKYLQKKSFKLPTSFLNHVHARSAPSSTNTSKTVDPNHKDKMKRRYYQRLIPSQAESHQQETSMNDDDDQADTSTAAMSDHRTTIDGDMPVTKSKTFFRRTVKQK